MASTAALPTLTPEPGFSDVGAPGRIHAGQALARARRPRRGARTFGRYNGTLPPPNACRVDPLLGLTPHRRCTGSAAGFI